ncbi:hypothetical protein TCAL_13536 [Tigriopus californicus]|uniref:Sec1 family domain-containing protein 2 n=2 Tax=Tigriopus californicus TaxID=6832 RepID=A0A553N8D0_TIGCA|nr:hypothetical protein TCAL_13536 [Tigriopus californicus]|eukprot:TCALIF_13536-PA protein Name:"Similar to Scfd2 Sec1 family domain-containing protein 2 (Mus musculus)" AED:0.21 eAED:0.24 QI:0/-1/0/1/-1/1/1/0/525
MGNTNYTCEVLHIPFHTLPLTHDFFMLPSFSDIFPIFNYTSADGKRIGPQGPSSISDYHASNNYQSNVEWSLDHLPCDLQFKAMEFVQALDSILQTLDVKEDIFTIGRFSKVVGEQLESLTSGKLRRKGTTRKVSIILVDRTLDMVTPCDCHFQVALDEIRASLPQFPGHEVDVQVDMKDTGYMFGNCVGGCLFDLKLNERQNHSLNDLIVKDMLSCQKSTREALKSVLNNSDDDDDFNSQDALSKFAEDPVEIEKHLHLVQRAQAMTNANCEKIIKRFEVLREIQAKFKKSMSNRQELLDNLPFLTKMIRLRRTSGISLDDILLLTTFLYALLPSDVSFFEEDEDRLQSALSEALISDQNHLSDILATIFAGQKLNEVLAYQVVKNIFVKLKALSKVKDGQNHTLKVQSQENLSESSQTSYLEKLALNLFSEDRRNIPDLQHITGGLGSMLKSGISLLGVKINTIHPRENPTIIIFVIGGITASEVRQIQQIAAARSKAKLWIGSTKMAGPWDSLRSLFIQDKL